MPKTLRTAASSRPACISARSYRSCAFAIAVTCCGLPRGYLLWMSCTSAANFRRLHSRYHHSRYNRHHTITSTHHRRQRQ